jgi:hypothetical protein
VHLVIPLSNLEVEQSYPAGQLGQTVNPLPEYVLAGQGIAAVESGQ